MYTLSRTRLLPGDPDRDWLVVASGDGLPAGQPSLVTANGQSVPLAADVPTRHWGSCGAYCRRLRVPVGTPAGPAKVYFTKPDVTPELVAEITILPLPNAYGRATITVSQTATEVQKAVDKQVQAKKTPYITLAPGHHVWEHVVNLPPNAVLELYGARVTGLPWGGYGSEMLSGGQDCSILGGQFDPAWMLWNPGAAVAGTVFRDTVVTGATRFSGGGAVFGGYQATEFLAQDIYFDRAMVGEHAPIGLWLRPTLANSQGGWPAFQVLPYAAADGQLLLIDCLFDGTDRGPTFQGGLSVRGCFVAGFEARGINTGNNGNEIFLFEGPLDCSGFTAVHTRVRDCESTLFQFWQAAVGGALIRDTVQHGGDGLWLAGIGGASQSGVVYEVFELHDTGGVQFGVRPQIGPGPKDGVNVTGNTLRRGAFLGWRPTRLNQTDVQPQYYRTPSVVAAPQIGGPTNAVEKVDFEGLPAGVVPVAGPAAADCRCGGVPVQTAPPVS